MTGPSYDPRSYWSRVGDEIGERSHGSVIAGDNTPFYTYKRQTMVDRFLRSLPAAGSEVLELGCGPGGNLYEIAQADPKLLVGCDISPTMLQLARKTTSGTHANLVEINGSSLPFRDEAFGVVFTVTVLQHNHDAMMEALLTELCRVTRDSLCLMEDTSKHKHVSYAAVGRPVSEYADVCERAGLRLESVEPLGIHASEWFAERLRARFNPASRKEGETITPRHERIERVALPVTKLADRIIRPTSGFMKMTFRRA